MSVSPFRTEYTIGPFSSREALLEEVENRLEKDGRGSRVSVRINVKTEMLHQYGGEDLALYKYTAFVLVEG